MQEVKLITNQEEINELYNFVKQFPLNYPHYDQWLKKCKEELESGYKNALVYKINEEIVANLIFQKHKEDSSMLELKNGRVLEEYRKRKIYTLLINKIVSYAKENGYKKIIVDVHEDDIGTIKTYDRLGFKVESHEKLYGENTEVVITLDLTSKTKNLDQIIYELQLKLEIVIEELITKLKKLFIIKCST